MDIGNPPRHRRFYTLREVAEWRFPPSTRPVHTEIRPLPGGFDKTVLYCNERTENAPPKRRSHEQARREGWVGELGVISSGPEFVKASDSDRNLGKLIEKFVFVFLDTIKLIAIYIFCSTKTTL